MRSTNCPATTVRPRSAAASAHFASTPRSGQLTFLNKVSSDGNDPCYLSLSPDGKYLLTANYSVAADPGGSFAVFPLQATASSARRCSPCITRAAVR